MAETLLAIVGPTCTGKTALAVRVAELLGPAELVSADSRQLRRVLHVATCAPTPAELRGVPCHLLDLAEPGESFTVADWVVLARDAIADIRARGAKPIVVGGTGLYVAALTGAFDFGAAPPDPGRRAARFATAGSPGGVELLAAELVRLAPEVAATVDLRNPRRVVRALEIHERRSGAGTTGRRAEPMPALLVGLDLARPAHEQRIRVRAGRMVEGGRLVEEVRSARAAGFDDRAVAACGIGYAEALALLDGRSDAVAAVESIVRRTLRYAKAQRTWWRRHPVAWLDPCTVGAEGLAREVLAQFGRPGAAALPPP